MKKLATIVIGISVVVAVLALTPSSASAQAQGIVYSVKFVCGLQTTIPSDPPNEPPVKQGNYATAINIHNFHFFPVEFATTATIADLPALPATGIIMTLNPERATEVDCTDIVQKFFAGVALPPFIKGFFTISILPQPFPVIPSVPELSVVGVYTAKECHKIKLPKPGTVPVPAKCDEKDFGELSLQVVPYRQPFTRP